MMQSIDSVYDKNIKFLSHKYPKILNKIEKNAAEVTVGIQQSRDGKLYMTVKKEDRLLHIHSKYKPDQEADKWVAVIDASRYKLLIIFGAGLFYPSVKCKYASNSGHCKPFY
jgi:hypothetical protein